jgi:2-keto-4-pentenoate hydratase/2-oxohepta-3-ene-1,7-dioic acid hydratase in catechol pathway
MQNMPVPDEPVVFSKFASAISNPGDDIIKAPEVQVGQVVLVTCVAIS